ncbi:MAG: plastocyanin/azurin family copper-binding protein [Thermoleophilaceae bacterium]
MLTLAAAQFTVYHVVGIIFVCWAVIVTVLGIRRPDFPGGAEKAVLAISVVLALGTIGTAVGTVKGEKKEKAEASQSKTKANPAPSPTQGQAAPTPSQQGASQLKLTADPTGNLKFNTSALSGRSGPVQITLTNPAPVPHNITLQTPQGVKGGPTVGKGGTSTVTANLKPGKYIYYCSVPGHRQAGMQGTLTVK